MEPLSLNRLSSAVAAAARRASILREARPLQILSNKSGVWSVCDDEELVCNQEIVLKPLNNATDAHVVHWGV